MDTIEINGLTLEARIGAYEEERKHPQRLRLNLRLGFDIKPSATSDDLSLTIDYATVVERLTAFAASGEWKLIETLAEAVSQVLLGEFKVQSCQVEIQKFILPNTDSVAVRISRP